MVLYRGGAQITSDVEVGHNNGRVESRVYGEGSPIDISAYWDELERDEKFCTVSIRDEKINDNDNNGNDPTEFSSDDKERGNTEVWGSEARMVDNYEGRMPVVDGLRSTIV